MLLHRLTGWLRRETDRTSAQVENKAQDEVVCRPPTQAERSRHGYPNRPPRRKPRGW